MPRHPLVMTALAEKRREIATRIAVLEHELVGLRADLSHLDAAANLLDPSYKTELLKPRRVYRKSQLFPKRDLGRILIDIIRTAADPMTAREMTPMVIKRAGIAITDPRIEKEVTLTIAKALYRYRDRGTVQSIPERGRNLKWVLLAL